MGVLIGAGVDHHLVGVLALLLLVVARDRACRPTPFLGWLIFWKLSFVALVLLKPILSVDILPQICQILLQYVMFPFKVITVYVFKVLDEFLLGIFYGCDEFIEGSLVLDFVLLFCLLVALHDVAGSICTVVVVLVEQAFEDLVSICFIFVHQTMVP